MSKQLIGKAALTYVRTDTGQVALVYAGRPCPGNILASERERLVPDFLEEVEIEDAVVGVELGTGIERTGWSGDPLGGADPLAVTFDPDNPEGPFIGPDGTAAGTRELAAQGSGAGDSSSTGNVSDEKPNGGTIAEVKAWVGDDADRAAAALDAEKGEAQPRSTLVDALEAKLADSEPADTSGVDEEGYPLKAAKPKPEGWAAMTDEEKRAYVYDAGDGSTPPAGGSSSTTPGGL